MGIFYGMWSQLDMIFGSTPIYGRFSPTSDGHVNIGGRPFLDKPYLSIYIYSIPLNSPKKDRSRPRCHGKKVEHMRRAFLITFAFCDDNSFMYVLDIQRISDMDPGDFFDNLTARSLLRETIPDWPNSISGSWVAPLVTWQAGKNCSTNRGVQWEII